MSEDPRPGTTSDIARRVERLEQSVAALTADVRVVQAGQNAQGSALGAIQSKLDLILSSQNLAAIAQADPEATPAGRLLLKEIAEAQLRATVAKASADALSLKVAAGGGAIAVLIVLINLFAPAIRQIIGLP
jgi:hypothetical protein